MAVVNATKGKLGKISFYNATAAGAENRQWPLGLFTVDQDGVPLTKEFEIKHSTHPKGDKRDEWSQGPAGVAISIILKGGFRFTVAPNGIDGEIVTNEIGPGEAILWENTVPHKWESLEDGTEVITVRRLEK